MRDNVKCPLYGIVPYYVMLHNVCKNLVELLKPKLDLCKSCNYLTLVILIAF
jgi:hypothetical protein